jgi:hypothetical protein
MKYSIDYAEGYLEGMGCLVFDQDTQKPASFKEILKFVITEIDFRYDYDVSKVLDCICTDEFLKIHPIN